MRNQILALIFSISMVSPWSVLAIEENVVPVPLKPTQAHSKAAGIITQVLTRFHYRPLPLDDAMSRSILGRYLKSLDSEKIVFVQADIDQFSGYATTLDDAIKAEDMSAPFVMFGLYQQRLNERYKYARNLLKRPFDFSVQEDYGYKRGNANWAITEDEIHEIWRKRVKSDWLNLKLAGKDEMAIRELLDKRYENFMTRANKLRQDDVFQLFMNAYTTSFDPMTDYYGPQFIDSYAISTRVSKVGIGAVLQQTEEYIVFRELVPGGSAHLSGQINVGDKIMGIGQGENGSFVDVVGFKLDDAVQLLRGSDGSRVRLNILPANAGLGGRYKEVVLERRRVSMDTQSAKKVIMTIVNGKIRHRVGVISVPTFYQDFAARSRGDKDFKSVTRDVLRLLTELKEEKVEGVLVDLRNNGGGALNEAVELASLFIGKGPVVVQRSSDGKEKVEKGTHAGVEWGGPMGVLIDRRTASGAEIFAAAIQDYGRGIVIGQGSFGAGTIQALVDLDVVAKSTSPQLGELKMTIAQFFRVNGDSTLLRGVTPDVAFAGISDGEDFGKSRQHNELPLINIKPVEFTPFGDLHEHFPELNARHQTRVAKDKDFRYLQEDLTEFRKQEKENFISLNESARRKELEAREVRMKVRQKADNDSSTTIDKRKISATKMQEKDKNQLGARTATPMNAIDPTEKVPAGSEDGKPKDVLLMEAMRIFSDEIELQK